MKKSIVLFLTILGLAFISSCQKEEKMSGLPGDLNNATSTEELEVPVDFDWKTSSETFITISPENSGFLMVKDEEGVIYHKAYLIAGQVYEVMISIPDTRGQVSVFFNGQNETVSRGASLKSKLK